MESSLAWDSQVLTEDFVTVKQICQSSPRAPLTPCLTYPWKVTVQHGTPHCFYSVRKALSQEGFSLLVSFPPILGSPSLVSAAEVTHPKAFPAPTAGMLFETVSRVPREPELNKTDLNALKQLQSPTTQQFTSPATTENTGKPEASTAHLETRVTRPQTFRRLHGALLPCKETKQIPFQ